MGKNAYRRNMVIMDNEFIHARMIAMIAMMEYGFPEDDPDIIAIKEIYENLEHIKTRL